MAEQTPPGFRDKIMHTRLDVAGIALMGSDAPHGRYARPAGTMVSIGIDDPAEADRLFAALSEGGQVGMADPGDVLGAALRHGDRPVRDALDGEQREPA